MPSARTSAAHAPRPTRAVPASATRGTRSTPGFQPRRVTSRAPLSRIRWDRASRVALLATLALIGYLWVSGIVSLLGARDQAVSGLAEVHRLAAQQKALAAEVRSLHQRATILAQARGLGMIDQGERGYIVTH